MQIQHSLVKSNTQPLDYRDEMKINDIKIKIDETKRKHKLNQQTVD